MHRARACTVLIVLLASLLVLFAPGAALDGTRASAAPLWTQPKALFRTPGHVADPVLVADPTGDVHLLFWHTDQRTPEATGSGSIMYARLHQGVWTDPSDVLQLPGVSSQEAAAVDDRGYLHVVWRGRATGQMYYSRAHVMEAQSAKSWTSPVQLSDSMSTNGEFGAANAIAASGSTVHVAFTTNSQLTYLRSDDSGQSWSAPLTVAATGGVDDPRIAADGHGRVFVTWTQYALPSGWPPVGTYFARSTDGGGTWSPPLRVTGGDRALLSIVSDGGDRVYRLWLSRAEIAQRTGQASADGGLTWGAPTPIASGQPGGLTGFPAMAFDSRGTLHLALAVGKGIYSLVWDGSGWSEPTLVSQGSIGLTSIEQPSLAIARGNQVHVAWEDDFSRVWYTGSVAAAPQTPAQGIAPPPTPVAATTPTPIPESQALGLTRPIPTLPAPRPADPTQPRTQDVDVRSAPLPPLVGAAVASLVVIAAALAYRLRRLE